MITILTNPVYDNMIFVYIITIAFHVVSTPALSTHMAPLGVTRFVITSMGAPAFIMKIARLGGFFTATFILTIINVIMLKTITSFMTMKILARLRHLALVCT
jgi:hypothetical protein